METNILIINVGSVVPKHYSFVLVLIIFVILVIDRLGNLEIRLRKNLNSVKEKINVIWELNIHLMEKNFL